MIGYVGLGEAYDSRERGCLKHYHISVLDSMYDFDTGVSLRG